MKKQKINLCIQFWYQWQERDSFWRRTASDMIVDAGAKEGKAESQCKKVVALLFIGRIPNREKSYGRAWNRIRASWLVGDDVSTEPSGKLPFIKLFIGVCVTLLRNMGIIVVGSLRGRPPKSTRTELGQRALKHKWHLVRTCHGIFPTREKKTGI